MDQNSVKEKQIQLHKEHQPWKNKSLSKYLNFGKGRDLVEIEESDARELETDFKPKVYWVKDPEILYIEQRIDDELLIRPYIFFIGLHTDNRGYIRRVDIKWRTIHRFRSLNDQIEKKIPF